jgi:regulator of replication initiation timing
MAAKRKLDRSQPYGSVFGSGSAAFEQFGICFDGAGNELPGFEEVEIPKAATVVVGGDDAGLKAQIQELLAENERLQGEVGKVRDVQADAEARTEEVQGKLDTAEVEIGRLTAQLEDLTKPAEAGKESIGKKGTKKTDDLDDQLSMQTGG